MNLFEIKSENSNNLTEKTKQTLNSIKIKNGFIPNLIGVLANKEQFLTYYVENSKLNASLSLTPIEKEIIQLTVAHYNGCEFCVAGHSNLARKIAKMPENLLNYILNEENNNSEEIEEKYKVLYKITILLLETKGNLRRLTNVDFYLNQFYKYYDKLVLIEILLGISLATFTNYVNNLNRTEINEELKN